MKKICLFISIILVALVATSCTSSNKKLSHLNTSAIQSSNTEKEEQNTGKIDSLLEATELLKPYNVYLLGEAHANTKTYKAELELMKYFYENHGTRKFMLETGYCTAALLNDYLKTGDTTILDKIMNDLNGSPSYNKDRRMFYESLHSYYKNLPIDDAFLLCGIDVQHQTSTGVYYLKTLLNENTPEEIKNIVFSLTEETFSTDFKSLEKLVEEKKESLGENYSKISETVNSIIQGITFYTNEDDEFREKCFTDNFFKVYDKKCVGIFGNWHTNLSGWPNDAWKFNNIAQNIAERIGTKEGGVASICFVYKNSYSRKGNNEKFSVDTEAGIVLSNRAISDIEFFVLDPNDKDKTISELYKWGQFALSITDSPAAESYR